MIFSGFGIGFAFSREVLAVRRVKVLLRDE